MSEVIKNNKDSKTSTLNLTNPVKPVNKENKSKTSFFVKFGTSLMLPVVMMIIGGFVKGLGLLISGVTQQATGSTDSIAYVIGNDISNLGGIVFDFLPVMFALSIALAFVKYEADSGYACFAAVLGYIVFSFFQDIFIHPQNPQDPQSSFNVWFFKDLNPGLFSKMLGFTVLNTSVISGIVFGLIAAWFMNRYGRTKLPMLLSFFDGQRLVLVILFFIAIPIACLFILIWPFLGIGLIKFGEYTAKAPYGLDSFCYGLLERSLIPFGLHNVINMLFYYTVAGGTLDISKVQINIDGKVETIYQYLQQNNPKLLHDVMSKSHGIISGDLNMWLFVETARIPFSILRDAGYNLGRFLYGRFPFMMFGLIGVALAIIATSAKSKRKFVISIMSSAALMDFVTGTTQPIEYTFLFVAPWLYYFVHVPLAGISWWLMSLLGSNCALVYSGGLIDFSIYGIIPDVLGLHTNCWLVPIIGVPLFFVYFGLFYYLIRWKNPATLGRDDLQGLSKDEVLKLTENWVDRKIIKLKNFYKRKFKKQKF